MTMLLSRNAATERNASPALAASPSTAGGQLLAGTVKAFLAEREAAVEVGVDRTVDARQAASCLLAPAVGDRVLVHVCDGAAYVLAVLERASTELTAELSVPGAADVALRSAGSLALESPKVGLVAREFGVLADVLSQAGGTLSASFRRIVETAIDKAVGARTITTRAQARTAVVTEVDTLSAGTLVQNVDKVAAHNSEISLLTARQDVRLDAKRVTVG
jgi:hypothetical protein